MAKPMATQGRTWQGATRLLSLALLTAATVLVTPSAANTQLATPPTVDVQQYGALGNGSTNDTAAIQRANDYVASRGGGTVLFSPGTYIAAGVKQDSNVEFAGVDPAVSTLKHPDGVTNLPIVQGRIKRTKGTVGEGSDQLQVTSTRGVAAGAVIAVRGAGGASTVQVTTLSASLTKTATTLSLTQPAAWAKRGTNFVLIDDEILGYTGISGSKMLNLKRGMFGTDVASHATGAAVAQLQALYARVRSVGSSTIVLDRPAVQAVLGADVFTGSVNMKVRDLTLDGNRRPGGSPSTNPFPLEYSYARWVQASDNVIRNGDHGAVMLDQGTSDSVIERNVLMDNGAPTAGLGAAIWLFRGATTNVVRDNQIGGSSYYGVAIDDRSVSSTEWDAPSSWNALVGNNIDIPRMNVNAAIFISAADGTEVASNNVRSTYTGISVLRSTQGLRALDARFNVVHDNTLTQHQRGIHVSGSKNTFARNTFTNVVQPVVDSGSGNTYS